MTVQGKNKARRMPSPLDRSQARRPDARGGEISGDDRRSQTAIASAAIVLVRVSLGIAPPGGTDGASEGTDGASRGRDEPPRGTNGPSVGTAKRSGPTDELPAGTDAASRGTDRMTKRPDEAPGPTGARARAQLRRPQPAPARVCASGKPLVIIGNRAAHVPPPTPLARRRPALAWDVIRRTCPYNERLCDASRSSP